VNDAPFPRLHRLEGESLAASPYLRGDPVRHALEVLFSTAPVSLNVDGDGSATLEPAAEEHVDEQLERGKRLAPPADEESHLLAANIQGHASVLLVIRGAPALLSRRGPYRRMEVHAVDQVFQDDLGRFRSVVNRGRRRLGRRGRRRACGSWRGRHTGAPARRSVLLPPKRHADDSLLGAETEEAQSPLFKNDDFDFGPRDAELAERLFDGLVDRLGRYFQAVAAHLSLLSHCFWRPRAGGVPGRPNR